MTGRCLTARAATPSGLSRFASSCQHRIAIAWRAMFPPRHVHRWEDDHVFASCIKVTIAAQGPATSRPAGWAVMQWCEDCGAHERRQLTRAEYSAWHVELERAFAEGKTLVIEHLLENFPPESAQ